MTNTDDLPRDEWPYWWRVRKWLPDRYGQPCRVLARGSMNSAMVEFPDGYRTITNRWFLRRRRDDEDDKSGAGT